MKYSEDEGTFERQSDEDFMKLTEDAGSFGTQSVSSTSTPSINPCTTTIQLMQMQPSSSTGPTNTNVDDYLSTVRLAPGTSNDDDQFMKD